MIRSSILLLLILTTSIWAGDPGPASISAYVVTPSWRDAQFDLASLQSKEFRMGLGFSDKGGVVKVTRTFPGSAANKSSISIGDTILSVNGRTISTSEEFKTVCDSIETAPLVLDVRRGSATSAIEIKRKVVDPLFYRLIYLADGTHETNTTIKELTHEEHSLVEEKAFTESRGFRTEDAHIRLKGHFPDGTLLMIRGGKRVLFVLPGWSTTCVNVRDYDGAHLTEEKLEKLLHRIIGKYQNYRYANP